MSKVALQAALCYNEASNTNALAVLETPRAVHLIRRCTLDSIPQKHCNGCQRDLPATLQYFSPQRQNKDHLTSQCKQCHAARTAQYRKNNPEKINAQTEKYKVSGARKIVKARYDAAHRDERIKYAQQWHEEHREEQRIYCAEYNTSHHEERLSYGRQRHADNREEMNARMRQYRNTAHGRMMRRVHQNKRRSYQLEISGFYTSQDIQVQYQRQKGKCYWCQAKLDTYHVDHIIPLIRGGSNDPSNLVLACPPCNTSKGAKLPHEWHKGGRLL